MLLFEEQSCLLLGSSFLGERQKIPVQEKKDLEELSVSFQLELMAGEASSQPEDALGVMEEQLSFSETKCSHPLEKGGQSSVFL